MKIILFILTLLITGCITNNPKDGDRVANEGSHGKRARQSTSKDCKKDPNYLYEKDLGCVPLNPFEVEIRKRAKKYRLKIRNS